MNKKGQAILDVIILPLDYIKWFFMFIFIILVVGTVVINFAQEVNNAGHVKEPDTNPAYNFALNYPKILDYIPLIVYLTFLIGGATISRLVPFNKGWVGLMLILSIVFSVVFMFMGNLLTFIIGQDAFSVVQSQLVIIPIMTQFSLILGLLFMIINTTALLVDRQ